MTKSIKEKERLFKIKEHERLGSKITPDLLKISLVYESPSRRRKSRSFRNRLVKPDIVKSLFHNYFKNNINKLMVDIATNLKIYDFKVNIRVSNMRFLSTPLKKGISLYLSVSNHKNQHLANLTCSNNEMRILRPFTEVKTIDDITNMMRQLLETFDNSFSLTLNLNTHRNYNDNSLNPRIKSLNNDIINKFIKNFEVAKSDYKDLQKDISIIKEDGLNIYTLEILINDSFYFRFSYECSYGYDNTDIYKFEDYDHMIYFKTIIKSIYPNLDVTDEQYTEENIEEIKSLAKISGY